jgi:hypothetical protein
VVNINMQRSRCALGELAENTPNHTDNGTMADPPVGHSIVRRENSCTSLFTVENRNMAAMEWQREWQVLDRVVTVENSFSGPRNGLLLKMRSMGKLHFTLNAYIRYN